VLSLVTCIRGCCVGGGAVGVMVMVFVIVFSMVLVWFALTSDDGRTDSFSSLLVFDLRLKNENPYFMSM
jgi:hypothetical protein